MAVLENHVLSTPQKNHIHVIEEVKEGPDEIVS